jgi:hypothetical protein
MFTPTALLLASPQEKNWHVLMNWGVWASS